MKTNRPLQRGGLPAAARWMILGLACGLGWNLSAMPGGEPAQAQPAAEHPYPFRLPAPPLDGGQWVNTTEPLSLAELRGRFVLLDFWTYCCINCIHVLPELKKLEHAFPNELVVIGVHSAKFEAERDTQNILNAVFRYEIEHPVVNDANRVIWQRYGARAWPTLVLIDPAGEVVWAASGERTFEDLKAVIDHGLPHYRAAGLLAPAPRPEVIECDLLGKTPLRFPGKVLADEAGGRLLIADSNHNRIVVAGLDGQLRQVIGSGAIGRDDGAFDACSFNHPQGMALVGDLLYVADTENHLLRSIDLAAQRVATVAGTGEKGAAHFQRRLHPTALALASPWALWAHDDDLYIAMAGPHQIWRMRLDGSHIAGFAGNGREDITDGPLLPRTAFDARFSAFAQPSGLASDGSRLFVADSEGSTIRAVPFNPRGQVETLVGLTGTLFDFGDVDGQGHEVRLQHPLGVAWWQGKLYVADTYNNKIKVIDVEERTSRTIAGSGEAAHRDADTGSQAAFHEPGGISAAGGTLYVADTNNHVIRLVDTAPPHRVTTLDIQGLTPP